MAEAPLCADNKSNVATYAYPDTVIIIIIII